MAVIFNAAILCDDIRKEDNGKYIAIGIYSSNVVVGMFPVISRYCLLMRARMEGAHSETLKFRVLVDGAEVQRMEGFIEGTQPGEDWLPIVLQPIKLDVPAPLTLEQESSEGEWSEFFRISVIRPPLTA